MREAPERVVARLEPVVSCEQRVDLGELRRANLGAPREPSLDERTMALDLLPRPGRRLEESMPYRELTMIDVKEVLRRRSAGTVTARLPASPA